MSGGPGDYMIDILNKFCIYSIPMSGGPGDSMIDILNSASSASFSDWVSNSYERICKVSRTMVIESETYK